MTDLPCSLSIIAWHTRNGRTSGHEGPSGPMGWTDPCGEEEGDQGKGQFWNVLEGVNLPLFSMLHVPSEDGAG